MADQIDEDTGEVVDVVVVPPNEVERQLQDINDEAFDELIKKAQALLVLFLDTEKNSLSAIEEARSKKADLLTKQHITLLATGYAQAWDLLAYLKNLRQV